MAKRRGSELSSVGVAVVALARRRLLELEHSTPRSRATTPMAGTPDHGDPERGADRVRSRRRCSSAPRPATRRARRPRPLRRRPVRSAPAAAATQKADVLVGEHGARGMVEASSRSRTTQRVELQQQMEQARAAAAAYPTVKDAEAAGYVPLDGVRAVHRRALHQRRTRDPLRPVAPVGVAVRRLDSRREDRRPELPRVPPQRSARRASPARTTTGTSTTRTAVCASSGGGVIARRRVVASASARRSAVTRRS